MISKPRKVLVGQTLHQKEHTVNQQIFDIHAQLETLDKLQNVFKNYPNPTVQKAVEQTKFKVQNQLAQMIQQGIDPIRILSEFGSKLFENEVIKSDTDLKNREMQPGATDHDIVDPISDEQVLYATNQRKNQQQQNNQKQNQYANAYYENLQRDFQDLQEHERQRAMEILVHNRYRPGRQQQQFRPDVRREDHKGAFDDIYNEEFGKENEDEDLINVHHVHFQPEPYHEFYRRQQKQSAMRQGEKSFESFKDRFGRDIELSRQQQEEAIRSNPRPSEMQFQSSSRQRQQEQLALPMQEFQPRNPEIYDPNYFRHVLQAQERFNKMGPLSAPQSVLVSNVIRPEIPKLALPPAEEIKGEENKDEDLSETSSQRGSSRQIKPETLEKLEELKQKTDETKKKQEKKQVAFGSQESSQKEEKKARSKSNLKLSEKDIIERVKNYLSDTRKTTLVIKPKLTNKTEFMKAANKQLQKEGIDQKNERDIIIEDLAREFGIK